MGRAAISVWSVGMVVGLLAEWAAYGWRSPSSWVPDLAVGLAIILCSGIVLMRERSLGVSALLGASGLLWFVPNFVETGPAWLRDLSAYTLFAHRGPMLHLLMAYPNGRPRSRLAWSAVAVGYGSAVAYPLWQNGVVSALLAVLFVLVSGLEYRNAVGTRRWARLVALVATIAVCGVIAFEGVVRVLVPVGTGQQLMLTAYGVVLVGVAVGLTVGSRLVQRVPPAVTDLVVALGEARSGLLRHQLARALGDPGLQVGYWVPEGAGYVDASGEPIHLPGPGSGRLMTMIERQGQPVAVLVHDPVTLSDAQVVEAVAAATRLAAANAQLQAEVRGQLAEIAASRRRIAQATDEERVQLEHRLRGAVELRLARLGEILQLAHKSAKGEATLTRLAESKLLLARALDDVRRLARGIHPRELAEHGLAQALIRLGADSPLVVHTSVDIPDLPVEVAACVYFVCSEGLANAAKHAATTNVAVSVTANDDDVLVVVEDRGVGGADPSCGSGVVNLADRVQALGGTVDIASPVAGGTRLIAVIPRDAGSRGQAVDRSSVKQGSPTERTRRSNDGSMTMTAQRSGL
jgi:signal transduction histidine kinase